MKNLIKNSGKNCLSILVIVLITMMFFVSNSNAYQNTEAVVQVKVAIEGLYNESNATLTKDAEVLVYLRNAEEPYKIVDVAKGLIDRATLTGTFTFTNVVQGQYYIVLKSRNTIETWSRKGGELIVNEKKTMYDFTVGKEKAYGENMKHSGKHASVYTGDVNQDGFVDETDIELVQKNMINFTKGNVPEDLNGDGFVGKADYQIVFTNAKLGIKAMIPIAFENWEKNVQAIMPSGFENSDESDIPMLTVQVKAAIEGLFNFNPVKGSMVKDPSVKVYLRNAESPYEVVAKAEGLINRSTLKATFNFWNVYSGQYYIVLKSKNSIETWSRKGGEPMLNETKVAYDFTTGTDKAFGENMVLNGKFACIYSGDVDQDGFVTKFDVVAVENDMHKVKGDVPTDLNGDEYVDESDYGIVYENWRKNVQAITPLDYLDQLTQKDASKEDFTLRQNSPNPFNPSTKITFNVANTSNVKLSIYDISGREIAQLINSVLTAGSYTFEWNASNFASGTYFYRINVNGIEQTLKMQLIK